MGRQMNEKEADFSCLQVMHTQECISAERGLSIQPVINIPKHIWEMHNTHKCKQMHTCTHTYPHTFLKTYLYWHFYCNPFQLFLCQYIHLWIYTYQSCQWVHCVKLDQFSTHLENGTQSWPDICYKNISECCLCSYLGL